MSSHTEFRAQLVSLSPGSYYSISAMLDPRVFEKRADPPLAPAPPPVTASRVAARRPPTHHATRTARMRVLAVPVGRRWLFQDFSLRRLLPGAARSVYHDKIIMREAMPTHLGTNPRNHVKHYSCFSLEFFLIITCIKLLLVCVVYLL